MKTPSFDCRLQTQLVSFPQPHKATINPGCKQPEVGSGLFEIRVVLFSHPSGGLELIT